MDDSTLQTTWADAAGPAAQVQLLTAALDDDDAWAETTTARLGTMLEGFALWATAHGVTDLSTLSTAMAADWVHARTRRGDLPAPSTLHLRRTALRAMATILQRIDPLHVDPTSTLRLPARSSRSLRPLTIDELALLRVACAAPSRGRRTARASVALSEAGATTGEIPLVRWADVDLVACTVALPGVGRTLPRTVPLSPWAARTLTELTGNGPHVLTPGSNQPGTDGAQAMVTTRLRALLTVAHIDDDAVRPTSIRLALPAARLEDEGRIDRAAIDLGCRSLDVAARLLQWEWR